MLYFSVWLTTCIGLQESVVLKQWVPRGNLQMQQTTPAPVHTLVFLGVFLRFKTNGVSQWTTVSSTVPHTSVHETPGVSHSLVSPPTPPPLFFGPIFPVLFVLVPSSQMDVGIFYSRVVQHSLSLSCAGQVRGSARRNLAVDETNAQKQLAQPPTIASRVAHLFCSQVKLGGWGGVIYIQKGRTHPIRGF